MELALINTKLDLECSEFRWAEPDSDDPAIVVRGLKGLGYALDQPRSSTCGEVAVRFSVDAVRPVSRTRRETAGL